MNDLNEDALRRAAKELREVGHRCPAQPEADLMSRNYGVPPRFRHGPSAVPDMDFRAHEDWGNREDDLDPPRGFMFVLALSGAFWAGTAFGVVMWQVFA